MGRIDRATFQARIDAMVGALRDEINSGALQPGQLLPSEVELSARFELSRNSIRGALELLAAEELVRKVPNVGHVVIAELRDKVKLKLGLYKSVMRDAAMLQLLEAYKKLKPEVEVQTIVLPAEIDTETVQSYMTSGMVDAISLPYLDFGLLQSDGVLGTLLEPLPPVPGTYPFLEEVYREGEALWLRPFLFSPVVLCYNRRHFQQAKLDEPDSGWSWEQLMRAACELRSEERYGFYFYLLSEHRWSVLLLQQGIRFKQGAALVETEGIQQALAFTRQLLQPQQGMPLVLLEGENDAELLFKQQKASMIMTTYFNLNGLQDCDFPFDVAPIPTSGAFKTLLVNIGVGLNRHSHHKDEARDFIDFLTGPVGQQLIANDTFSLPALKPAAEGRSAGHASGISRFAMYREIVPTFRYYTELGLTPRQFLKMRGDLKLYWAGLESMEQVTAKIVH
ncbi:extracellular solute-binding protein [Paenibacillus koleovorans]|uniref:extracellular solute-binding protein n=1 Tax=Paenibacillus koleovorans TaxID=121608 RepID=UPI000FD6FF55|nr:extracellular solute-binding protein [Paenibacillus koleovorans]